MSKKVDVRDYIKFHPQQKKAYQYLGRGGKIFYGGARGGGKTHFSRASAVLVALMFPGIEIVIIRKHLAELQNLFVDKIKQMYPEGVFKYRYAVIHKTFYFANGSKIMLQAVETRDDALKVQGQEYQLMIIDEANQFVYDYIDLMYASLRHGGAKWKFTPTLLMTGNPGGKSDFYFKTRFINKDYKHWTSQELKYKENYIFIPAKVDDNPSVDEDYKNKLDSIADPELRKAWLDGDWNVFQGQFFTMWNAEQHVIEPFDIPRHWRRVGGIDLGWTEKHPTICLWIAQDPETEFLYVYNEYIGHGKNFSVEEAADQIFYYSDSNDIMYYADPSMFGSSIKYHKENDTSDMIFMKVGLSLTPAKNARVDGWRVVKQWLAWTQTREPKLKVFDRCHHLIQTLPTLSYKQNISGLADDLDTNQSDDAADALRYALVTGFGFPALLREKGKLEQVYSEEMEMKQQKKLEEEFVRVGYNDYISEEKVGINFYESNVVSSASNFG